MITILLSIFMATRGASSSGQDVPDRLGVETRVVPAKALFGEPLQLSVVLKNIGDQSVLVLARDANFLVDVESGNGSQQIALPRYTRRASRFKDDELPLRPGDALTRRLPVQLNDLQAMPGEGWVGPPGTYRIRIRYDSERSVQEHSDAVMRTSASSPWTEVRIAEPSRQQRTQRLREIKNCIENDECDGVILANFYRVVRDKDAADLLLRLLERRPFNIWLLDAIVNQRRMPDATLLRRMAAKITDTALRERFVEAAVKLERFGQR